MYRTEKSPSGANGIGMRGWIFRRIECSNGRMVPLGRGDQNF